MHKIAIIIPFFGKLPGYINYFIETCSYNKNLDFIIFTDDTINGFDKFINITFLQSSLTEFNILASKKLGFNVAIKNGYKLCDVKPMYGIIYEDYLLNYDFWGYCDTDIIFGDTSKIITTELLNNYDIISSHDQYMAGPFSLYRNILEANILFTKSKDYKRVLQEETILFFDEASSVIRHLWEGHDIFDFQSEIESMTHLVKNPVKHNLRVKFTGYITERLPSTLHWSNGILRDLTGKETHIFHYIVYKSKLTFNIATFHLSKPFYFTKNGFFINNLSSYSIDWPKAITKNFSEKAVKKLSSFFTAKN